MTLFLPSSVQGAGGFCEVPLPCHGGGAELQFVAEQHILQGWVTCPGFGFVELSHQLLCCRRW